MPKSATYTEAHSMKEHKQKQGVIRTRRMEPW